MSIDLEYFRWERFEGGYEWTDAESITQLQEIDDVKHRDTRFLTENPISERSLLYNPLVKFPALFLEFAALEPGEDGFRRFANEYGLLGIAHFLVRSGPLVVGEPLSMWWEAWSRIHAVVHVLDAMKSDDPARLEMLIRLEKEHASIRVELPNGSLWAGLLADQGEFRPWLWTYAKQGATKREQLRRFASGWVQEQVNENLKGKTQGPSTVSARVMFSDAKGAYVLHLVPASLLGAMWLQCARVLTLNPTFKACEHCGKWFELSADARRRHTKYCSDRCKVAAYRARMPSRTKPR